MKKRTLALAVATLVVGVAGTGCAVTPQSSAAASGNGSLEARIAELEKKVVLVQDVQYIYNLQNAYGYYLDRSLFDDVSDLFTDDAVVEINARGVYKGKNVRNLFKGAMGGGENGLQFGRVNTHMQLQGVVNVDPDGQNAQGRWRSFAMLGSAGRGGKPGFGMWSEGIYEITYRKVNGKWMFQTMRWDPMINAEFHQGWDRQLTESEEALAPGATPVVAAAQPGAPGVAGQASVVQGANLNQRFPPDEPPTRRIKPFPEIDVLPFHYVNPVTGKPTAIPEPRP